MERAATYIIAAFILILDLVSKLLVEDRLGINESYVPIASLEPIFKITHVSNTGAAFGLFPSGSKVIMVIAIIVSIVIIAYNQKLPANHKLFRLALGL
ncbi:MAG: signal peptidase II, partial [Candidatus Promineifilaceae bacterium]